MFKIKKLRLVNFRGFTDTTIEFDDRITCIAGINGAGKSSVLQALSKILESLDATLPTHSYITENDFNKNIKNPKVKIELDYLLGNAVCEKKITSEGIFSIQEDSFLNYKKTHDLIISYYSVNRSDLDLDITIDKGKDLSAKSEAMTNAFNSVTRYKEFFQWFRDREDRENAIKLEKYEKGDVQKIYEDTELKAVRNAISALTPDFSKMKIDSNRQTIIVTKENATLDFSTLSDGEKAIITLFGDIARRLAIVNEKLENPLDGNGIILIDEIDLHLHPSWQRKICRALVETFPNCQFVVTTHSPQILGELKTSEIWLLNNFDAYRPDSSYGVSTNDILDEIMNVFENDKSLSRNGEIAELLSNVSKLIELEKFSDAKKAIAQIESKIGGEIHETVKYKTIIETLETE